STPEGALMAASGMTPAETLINKRKDRFGARMAAAPVSKDNANYPGAWSGLRAERTAAWGEPTGYGWEKVIEEIRTGENTFSKGTVTIDASKDAAFERAEATLKEELAYFTDGSRLESGRAGAACVRVLGGSKKTTKKVSRPMGRGKEAFDAE